MSHKTNKTDTKSLFLICELIIILFHDVPLVCCMGIGRPESQPTLPSIPPSLRDIIIIPLAPPFTASCQIVPFELQLLVVSHSKMHEVSSPFTR